MTSSIQTRLPRQNLLNKPSLAAEHLFQNGSCRCQILGFLGDKFLGIECTLEAETSVSNLTQYRLFIGDDKKNTLFVVTFSFKRTYQDLSSEVGPVRDIDLGVIHISLKTDVLHLLKMQ